MKKATRTGLRPRASQTDEALLQFASRLSEAVGGSAPAWSANGRQVDFKTPEGYEAGLDWDAFKKTATVFVYALTPRTLFLPTLGDADLQRAAAFLKSRGQERPPVAASAVRAAAPSYAEVEEALRGFLERNPDVAKDTSVARGAKLDDILKGAIATMAFEGDGSLFDTLNYGTGNAARDQAVLKDLSDTLSAMGLYYEMGHDWSLGVYPSDETSEERKSRELLDRLAQAVKADPDDLEAVSEESTPEGPVATVRHGRNTYYVGDDMALHALAVERVLQQIDEDMALLKEGKEPAYYSVDQYVGWSDKAAVRESAEAAAQEVSDQEVDELSTDEKREWLDENVEGWAARALQKAGIDPAQAEANGEEPTDEQVDQEFGAHVSEWSEARAAAAVGEDPWGYLSDLVGGDDGMAAYLVRNGLVDTARMADEIVSNDGFESVLGGDLRTEGGVTFLEAA